MENVVVISIIVPVYNASAYLQKCARSVLNQEVEEFELIFVNDGSTDDSLTELQKISNWDKRIKLFNQKNNGVTSARKLGWSKSKGKYISFLDADDVLEDNALTILLQHARESNYDVVNASFVGEPSQRVWRHRILGELNQKQYLKSLVFGDTYGVLYASLYKKSLFTNETFAVDASVKIGEDVLMNLLLCKSVNKVFNSDKIVYQYNDQVVGSAMNSIIRHPNYFIKFFKIRNQILKSLDILEFEGDTKMLLEKKDANEIINSFFNVSVKYDAKLYREVSRLKNQMPNSGFKRFLLSNKWSFIIFKKVSVFLTRIFIRKKLMRRVIE